MDTGRGTAGTEHRQPASGALPEGERSERTDPVRERRERLIRGFSHDVRNPLNAADGYLALLDDGRLDLASGRGGEAIRRARRSIRSALALIDDLVAFSEVGSGGRLELHVTVVDIGEIARDVVEDYRARGEAKGLTLRIRLPRQLPPVHSDPARVRQILGNLLSNAVKFTDHGGVEVAVEPAEVEARRGPRPGVATHVLDTGPGIPAEKVDLLFREFSRLGSEKEGTGLGLAISRRIARALGGEVTLSSWWGRGSRFTLWLPAEGSRVGRRDA